MQRKKRQPSTKHRTWKNQEKLSEVGRLKKCILTIIKQFFFWIKKMVLFRGLRFFALWSMFQNDLFGLSKTTVKHIFKFFTIWGVPYCQKVTWSRKKVEKKIQFREKKRNKKMGGRSCFIPSGALGHGLSYRAPLPPTQSTGSSWATSSLTGSREEPMF